MMTITNKLPNLHRWIKMMSELSHDAPYWTNGMFAQDCVHAMEALAGEGYVVMPVVPSPGLLMSMAIRFDHGLGMPGYYDKIGQAMGLPGVTHERRVQSAIATMRQLHEEVVGKGFYKPEKEGEYARMLEARA